MRRPTDELPADHAWVELHRAALQTTPRNPDGYMDISRPTDRQLTRAGAATGHWQPATGQSRDQRPGAYAVNSRKYSHPISTWMSWCDGAHDLREPPPPPTPRRVSDDQPSTLTITG